MSLAPVLRSVPASAFARAAGYQVLATGAPAKSRCTLAAPAWPRTAELLLQVSAWKLAPTRITTVLFSTAPQRFAAYCMALKRCSPIVVPGLPPAGESGVG